MAKYRGERGRSAKTAEIVEATIEILSAMKPMGVRQVCYQLFNRKLIPSMGRLETQRISRVLTGARKRGEIDFDDIVDRGRQIKKVSTWDSPEEIVESAMRQYRKDFWSWQPYRIIVVSEKAGLEGVLDPVIRRWGVDWLGVGGFNSTTRMHDMADDIKGDKRETIILYVGDFDPSGMYMSEVDFPERLDEYGAVGYQLIRVALTRSDVTGLPSFEAEEKKTDSRYRWFVSQFGETCVELDALDPRELRRRVEEAILQYVDRDAWDRTQLAEKAERESIQQILKKMRKSA